MITIKDIFTATRKKMLKNGLMNLMEKRDEK